ncbi:MAG: L-threonylcarbamoyladenylate synthase, partial [Acidobacteriota bacterium]
LKGRRADAALPLVAASTAAARAAGQFGSSEMRLAAAFWPGPLSIVVPALAIVSRAARAADGSVAIRVPAHAVARALASALGFAITATSANASGSAPAESADDVAQHLGGVDLLLDAGPAPGGLPSTMVSLAGGAPVLVRAGAIAWERVLKSLQ